jgi:3-hydroxyisobutyrate dehydrogenase
MSEHSDAGGHVTGPIGFIGTGTIGNPMARCLVHAGYDLVVHDARPEAAANLVDAGAAWAASPSEVAEHCTLVLTSLPGPAEIDAVVLGPQGVLAGASVGTVHVDLSTSSIAAARRLAARESEAGVRFVDAPVSGGAVGAEKGELTVMVSGPADAIASAEPVFEVLGSRVFRLGDEPGAATLVKLVNNAIFLSSGLLFQEGLVLAAKAGIDPAVLQPVLQSSSAAMYLGLAAPALARNFDAPIFTLALAEKDISLALESARDLGVPLPVTSAAHQTYVRARAAGLGSKVFWATLQAIERDAGVEVPVYVNPA